MNVNEALNLLSNLEDGLAAETDPKVRAWRALEASLQPDIILARQTMAEAATVAGLIGQVAELKAAQSAPTEGVTLEEVEAIDNQPKILSPEEQLRQRFEKRYLACRKQYEQEMSAIATTKKSKREHLEMLARRSFARRLNDISSLTGDAHMTNRADLLSTFAGEICDDDALLKEVFSNCAVYAQKNTLEVTGDPMNFGRIIAGSVEGRPSAAGFEEIIKGIFKTERSNYFQLQTNLTHASFEVLEDYQALSQLCNIFFLRKPYIPIAFHAEKLKKDLELLRQSDARGIIDSTQINAIAGVLSSDVTGINLPTSNRELDAVMALQLKKDSKQQILDDIDPAVKDIIMAVITEGDHGVTDYDPVSLTSVDGTKSIDLGLKPASPELSAAMNQSELFKKRMQELAPYSYAIRAAKDIVGGAHGIILVLSPNLCFDVYIPMGDTFVTSPSLEQLTMISDRVQEKMGSIMQTASKAKELGVSSFDESGHVGMIYEPLFDDIRDGLIIYRPATGLDRRVHASIQQLFMTQHRIAMKEHELGKTRSPEELAEENTTLRSEIAATKARFLGRRPVKFFMHGPAKESGLESISLRMDSKRPVIIAEVLTDEGEVTLELDRQFGINTADSRSGLDYEGGRGSDIKLFFENVILKLVKHWACSYEVRTSEGIIGESTKKSANMGHFAYLRVRPKDGYKFRYQQDQWDACMEEQGLDLAAESTRRQSLDPSGQARNSTYVRENYDPDLPALVVFGADI